MKFAKVYASSSLTGALPARSFSSGDRVSDGETVWERERVSEWKRKRKTAFYRPTVLSRLDGDSERGEARPSLRGGKSRRSAATAHLLAHVSMPNMYVSTCEQKLEPNGGVSVYVHAHLSREWCYDGNGRFIQLIATYEGKIKLRIVLADKLCTVVRYTWICKLPKWITFVGFMWLTSVVYITCITLIYGCDLFRARICIRTMRFTLIHVTLNVENSFRTACCW